MDPTPEGFMVYPSYNINNMHRSYLQSKKRMLKLNVTKAHFLKEGRLLRMFKKLEGWG